MMLRSRTLRGTAGDLTKSKVCALIPGALRKIMDSLMFNKRKSRVANSVMFRRSLALFGEPFAMASRHGSGKTLLVGCFEEGGRYGALDGERW